GTMGSGKSTLLKKLTMENYARNNFIRGFDVVGEFEELVRKQEGHMISLDGSQGKINPLQVFKTVNSSEGEEISKEQKRQDDLDSFKQHISKISIFYTFLSGSPTDSEIKEFKKLLRNFYEEQGFFSSGKPITGLEPSEYPILEDFLMYVKEQLYEESDEKNSHKGIDVAKSELTDSRIQRLEDIELVLE